MQRSVKKKCEKEGKVYVLRWTKKGSPSCVWGSHEEHVSKHCQVTVYTISRCPCVCKKVLITQGQHNTILFDNTCYATSRVQLAVRLWIQYLLCHLLCLCWWHTPHKDDTMPRQSHIVQLCTQHLLCWHPCQSPDSHLDKHALWSLEPRPWLPVPNQEPENKVGSQSQVC